MQCDRYPQKENIEGAGGWDCKNKDSESWGLAGPAKARMVRVEVVKPAQKGLDLPKMRARVAKQRTKVVILSS